MQAPRLERFSKNPHQKRKETRMVKCSNHKRRILQKAYLILGVYVLAGMLRAGTPEDGRALDRNARVHGAVVQSAFNRHGNYLKHPLVGRPEFRCSWKKLPGNLRECRIDELIFDLHTEILDSSRSGNAEVVLRFGISHGSLSDPQMNLPIFSVIPDRASVRRIGMTVYGGEENIVSYAIAFPYDLGQRKQTIRFVLRNLKVIDADRDFNRNPILRIRCTQLKPTDQFGGGPLLRDNLLTQLRIY